MENYYQILGVTTSATAHELRRAYRILARRYHPDVNPGKSSEEKFKTIAEAYSVLSDKERRRQYDEQLERFVRSSVNQGFQAYQRNQQRARREESGRREHVRPNGTTDRSGPRPPPHTTPPPREERKGGEFLITRLIRTLGRKRGQRKAAQAEAASPHLNKVSIIEISLTIRDALLGVKKTIEIAEPGGARKVSVRIPSGVRTGSVVRLRGRAGSNEELVLIIRVASHPYLSMHPRGLVVEVPVTVNEALYGASIVLPTLDEPAIVKVPAGAQSGQEIRIKGKGAHLRDGTRGDIFVRIMIHAPESPQAHGLKELATELEKYYATPVRQGLPQNLLE